MDDLKTVFQVFGYEGYQKIIPEEYHTDPSSKNQTDRKETEMKKDLLLYSIVPLDIEHMDEVCEDIVLQYRTGVSSCPLFMMTLVPEGNPPVDKAAIMCKNYLLFKEKLDRLGIPSGILVQASIGHGWVLSEMFPYQRYTNLIDGEEPYVVCPYDEGFRDYCRGFMTTIASCHPSVVMVDDDLRLLGRSGSGCACELHMNRFRQLSGTDMDRVSLRDLLFSGTEKGKQTAELFVETQKDSLLGAALAMREGLDAVDPTLPGCYCCVGNNAEFAYEIASALAGKGNPVVVRINNGNYTAAGARGIGNAAYRAASQIAKLKDKVDCILAETDTCPQNRYSTGAMQLHAHFTATILEGAGGAKHWITRLGAHEPSSGKAYRKKLSQYAGFYRTLAGLVPSLDWQGLRMPITDVAYYDFGTLTGTPENGLSTDNWGCIAGHYSGWGKCVAEWMGLPMYFGAKKGGILCLEGDAPDYISDEALKGALSGPVLLAGDSAMRLIKRGFGDLIGVDVRPWEGKTPSLELLSVNNNKTSVQKNALELIPKEGALEDSAVYHTVDAIHLEKLFPGSVIYHNASGGTVFTFCGTPLTPYNLVDAFSFLNESRKAQLVRMLFSTGCCPACFAGDEEVYFRTALMPDGGLFCALFNMGLDPMDEAVLFLNRSCQSAEILNADGEWSPVPFDLKDGILTVRKQVLTLDPLILRIR